MERRREANKKGEGGERPRSPTLAETQDVGLFRPQTRCTPSSRRRPWRSLRGQHKCGANPQLCEKPEMRPRVSAEAQPPLEERRGEKTQQGEPPQP